MAQENPFAVMYGRNNAFLGYIEHLHRLIDRPHVGAIDGCFEEWGVSFKNKSELSLAERLKMVSTAAPAIRKARELGGSSYPLAKAIADAVDEAASYDYNSCFVNTVLDIVDPNRSLKRYSPRPLIELQLPNEVSTSGGSVVWEEARETQLRKEHE